MGERKNISTHLDKSVIQLFIVVFLIATTTLAFRYANDAPCDEILFEHSANAYRVGEMVKFKDKTNGAQEWKWDFGDGSEISTQKNPFYIFTAEGDYEVRLVVNDRCEKTETITIAQNLVLLDSTKFPKFELPKTILVGQILNVKTETENASSYEWRFGETASVNATTKIAEYVYEAPGLKTISLIVNNDLKYIQKKKINVLPLPESKVKIQKTARKIRDKRLDLRQAPEGIVVEEEVTEKDTPNIVPFVTTGNFENKIKMVADGKLNPQAFSEFFCEDENPLVEANGTNTTFFNFCENISGNKIKVKSLSLIRKSGSNCITTFKIEYKKSGLF